MDIKFFPLFYINGIITLFIWRASQLDAYLLIATHEPIGAFISRLLVSKVQKKSIAECFGSVNELYYLSGWFYLFLSRAIHFILITIRSLTETCKSISSFLSDFITSFSLSLPLLYFFRPQKTDG